MLQSLIKRRKKIISATDCTDEKNTTKTDTKTFMGSGEALDRYKNIAKNQDKAKAKKAKETGYSSTRFSDIAGLSEVKKDMKSLVDFLVNGEKYRNAGAELPKGVLLYGPPGTGKTMLAKAVACEANVPFHYMSGSDFIEMYVGIGAKRVRELFDKARRKTPSIIFIDEIDTIGSKRRSADSTGEDRKTLNALLTEMDGFVGSDDIIVIGATNRLQDLDPALTRPGRFTDKFCVPLPENADERRAVIDLYVKDKKLGEDVDLSNLAKETIGFSPAKIQALLNEAAIISVQSGRTFIMNEDLEKAMFKVMLNGHEKKNQKNEKTIEKLKAIAWHEAGHALIGHLNGKDIPKVTIIGSTSGAGGVTFSIPTEEGGLRSAMELENEVKELYGGRAAEYLYFGSDKKKVTTGASNDIERATAIIRDYVMRYGMSNEFGAMDLTQTKTGLESETVIKCQTEMAKRLEKETIKILKENKETLSKIAEELLEKETLHNDDFLRILGLKCH